MEPKDSASGQKTSEKEENEELGIGEKIKRFFSFRECPVLRSPDIESVVECIQASKCKNIITMAGAGISTSAGIPDFRSPGSGLYDNLADYDLPYPTAIFELSYFHKNPEPFFVLAKNLFPSELHPTPTHYFVKLLQDKGLLLRHYTQNIDTLERVAGVSDKKLVEAHGSFRSGHCTKCQAVYDLAWLRGKILIETVPKCEIKSCHGVVKPDVILFGEGLPAKFFTSMFSDFGKCDLLIILGTSLYVQPFASLVNRVKKNVPRLYINLEKPPESSTGGFLMSLMGLGVSFKAGSAGNTRDVFWRGECDQGCQLLAKMLGWENDLEKIIKEGKPFVF